MLHHVENHLNNVRQRPDHKKRQYAFFVSLGFTLIIFVFWVSTKSFSLNPEATAKVEPRSPISSVTASAGDAWGYVKSFFVSSPNKVEYDSSLIEVTGK